jgi:hypothetical protein
VAADFEVEVLFREEVEVSELMARTNHSQKEKEYWKKKKVEIWIWSFDCDLNARKKEVQRFWKNKDENNQRYTISPPQTIKVRTLPRTINVKMAFKKKYWKQLQPGCKMK